MNTPKRGSRGEPRLVEVARRGAVCGRHQCAGNAERIPDLRDWRSLLLIRRSVIVDAIHADLTLTRFLLEAPKELDQLLCERHASALEEWLDDRSSPHKRGGH